MKNYANNKEVVSNKVITPVNAYSIPRKGISILDKALAYMKLNLIKTNGGSKRFDAEEIAVIIKSLKSDDQELLNTLLNEKDYWGNERFRGYDIARILKNNKDSKAAKKLITAKMVVFGQEFEVPAFTSKEIISILSSLNEYNEKILNKLLRIQANKNTIKNSSNKSNLPEQLSGQDIVKMMIKCKTESNLNELKDLLKV